MIKRFANLKVRYQLLMVMLLITSAALFLIGQLSYSYFYRRNTNELMQKAESSVHMAGASLSSQLTSLSTATNHLLVSPPFPRMIWDINNRNFTGYAKYFSGAVALTEPFLQNHDLISNVIICGEDNIVFSPSSLGIADSFSRLFPEDIWASKKITVLPTRQNFTFRQGGIIPVCYPVSSNMNSNSLIYQDKPGNRKARFILMIDTAQIRSYFEQMSNRYTYCMYLADENGNPLDIRSSQFPDAFLPEVKDWVKAETSASNGSIGLSKDQLLITKEAVSFCGLNVVHLTKKSSLVGDTRELRSFFILVWLACFLAAALLSFALSNLLTRNIKVLGKIIGRINDGTYHKKRNSPIPMKSVFWGYSLTKCMIPYSFSWDRLRRRNKKRPRQRYRCYQNKSIPIFFTTR